MKTFLICLLFYLPFVGFAQSAAIHPKCPKNQDAVAATDCTEEKVASFIHEKIRYLYYYDGKTTKTSIKFAINEKGVLESPNVSILEGEAAGDDILKALNALSLSTFFIAASDGNSAILSNLEMEVVFGEKNFTINGHQKKETGSKSNNASIFDPNRVIHTDISYHPEIKKTTSNKMDSLPKTKITTKKEKDGTTEPVVEEIFKVCEVMPRFYSDDCESGSGTNKEKTNCAIEALLNFVYDNLKYPPIASENGVEGTVVTQFIVEKDGFIKDARVVRDIGAQCGAAALRVVNLMNTEARWLPGSQRGKSVRVQYNLPIKFRLDENQRMVIPDVSTYIRN